MEMNMQAATLCRVQGYGNVGLQVTVENHMAKQMKHEAKPGVIFYMELVLSYVIRMPYLVVYPFLRWLNLKALNPKS